MADLPGAQVTVPAEPTPRFVARRPQTQSSEPAGESRADPPVSAVSPGRGIGLDEFAQLAPLIADPAVTDVFVNGPRQLWTDRGNGLVQLPPLPLDETQLRDLAVRLIAAGGRHIDETSPCVDVRLRDGIRVHAVLPPISTNGTLLSIRLPAVLRPSVAELDACGFFHDVPLAFVARLVRERHNILITGASGSGKTTLLAALLSTAAATDRIVAIEDVAELRVDHPHFVSLEARQANLEGAGAVGAERLVREALRMRPDRLVVGECRGAEVRELLSALNTGHDGGGGTMHANTLEDVPARLEALGALAGLTPSAIARQAVSAVGMVLHLARRADVRRLVQAGRLGLDARDRLCITPVDPELSLTAGLS
jgi:pilus assembly protein CpaF